METAIVPLMLSLGRQRHANQHILGVALGGG